MSAATVIPLRRQVVPLTPENLTAMLAQATRQKGWSINFETSAEGQPVVCMWRLQAVRP